MKFFTDVINGYSSHVPSCVHSEVKMSQITEAARVLLAISYLEEIWRLFHKLGCRFN